MVTTIKAKHAGTPIVRGNDELMESDVILLKAGSTKITEKNQHLISFSIGKSREVKQFYNCLSIQKETSKFNKENQYLYLTFINLPL
jgi:hypothetical protein